MKLAVAIVIAIIVHETNCEQQRIYIHLSFCVAQWSIEFHIESLQKVRISNMDLKLERKRADIVTIRQFTLCLFDWELEWIKTNNVPRRVRILTDNPVTMSMNKP